MPAITVKLDKLLEERGLSRYRLAEYAKDNSNLGRSTVFSIVQGRFQPRLETLAALMGGIEELTGKPVTITDVLEYDRDAPNAPVRDELKVMMERSKRLRDKVESEFCKE